MKEIFVLKKPSDAEGPFFSQSFMSNDGVLNPLTLALFHIVAQVVPSLRSQMNQTTSFSGLPGE